MINTLGQTAGSILGRLVANSIIKGFSGNTTGRYPHPRFGPVIAGGEEGGSPRVQITFPGFLALFGAALWAISKRGSRSMGQSEQPGLFPKLRRELRFEPEDVATSADPVEACLERRYGWNLKRVRELRDSIAAKETPGLFTKEKDPLTAAEAQLLENIEDCLERVQKQYGSLEAAGLSLTECPLCGDEEDQHE